MTPRRSRIRFACLLVALFGTGPALLHGSLAGDPAERGLPIFETPRVDSAFVDGPVTGFARGKGGVLFVASRWLSVFDGAQWRRIEVPGASRVFALAASADGRRIWVGASGTLGYIECNPQGEWRFVSLKAQLAAAGVPDGDEVRYVFPTPRGVFFVGFARAYLWDGTRLAVWNLPTEWRLVACTDGNQVYIYQLGVGFFRMEVAGPKLWMTERSMPAGPPIFSFVTLHNGTQIALFPDGVFRWAEGHWIRLDGLSDFVKGKLARRCVVLPDDTLAIGTTYGGLILADADGTVRSAIDTQGGLTNNLVSGLWLAETGQLWVGLNIGFTCLTGTTYASLFDQRSRLSDRDMLKVLLYDGRPHVVANDYLFAMVPASGGERASFSRIPIFWKTLRDALVVDGDLWVGDTAGLWRVAKGTGAREQMLAGDVFLLLAPRSIPGGILCFERAGCKLWLPGAGKGNPVDLKQPLDSVPVSAIEDSAGAVWLSTANGQVRRFAWDASAHTLRLSAGLRPGRGLPDGVTRLVLTGVHGAILAFTNTGILAWDPAANAFTPAPGLNGLIGVAGAATGKKGYWIVQAQKLRDQGSLALIKVTAPDVVGKPFTYEPIFAPGLNLVRETSRVSVTNGGGGEVLWLGGIDSVLRLETSSLGPANPPPGLMLHRVQTDTEGLVALTDGLSPAFKAGVRRVGFSFGPGAAAAADGLLYETRLEPVEHEWTPPQSSGAREYTGLAPGQYTLAARAIDRFGRIGRPLEYSFVIAAPWNQQAWFPFVLLLPVALGLFGVYRLRLAQQASRMNLRLESQAMERNRIARELHDTILQGFIGISLKLDAIATNLPESLAPVREQLRKILDQSDQYLTEARRSVMELRSATPEKADDFSHALSAAGERLTEGTGIQLNYSVVGERRALPLLIEGNLLRIGEEAVSNAVRHAQATEVEMSLKFARKEVVLRIQDNGRGFEPQGPEADKVGHFGLVGIQERAKAISGRLSFASQPGQGTEIVVTVPTG